MKQVVNGAVEHNKENTNTATGDRYARKTFHTVRGKNPASGSNGNLGALCPQIMSRTKSKKNDQSFDTHMGILGTSEIPRKGE